MPANVARQVAHRVWLKQIHESEYVKQEGWDPNFIKLGDKQISRINIIATIVGKFVADDGNYAALTLDDGTDTIRIKAFGPDVKFVENVNVGSVVRFVGKIKQYNDETYLSPEIVKLLEDPNWLILHKLELGKIDPRTGEEQVTLQKPLTQVTSASVGKKEATAESESNVSAQVLKKIQQKDKGDGASCAEIITEIGNESLAKSKIAELLASGEIYEPKKGFLKLL